MTRSRDTADIVEDVSVELASKVDYALPTNAQTGTAYTFVAADAEKLTTASNGSAVTFTIPPQSSVAWGDDTILRVVNYGAGALTVDGGSGVTVTNTAATIGQYGGGAAIRTGSDAWTFVPFGGGEVQPSSVEYLVIAGGGGGNGSSSTTGSAGGVNTGGGRRRWFQFQCWRRWRFWCRNHSLSGYVCRCFRYNR